MMDNGLEAIVRKFPEYREKIMIHAGENEDFKCLCSDYERCIQMLESLTEKTDPRKALLEEYLEIKIELEQEVVKFLIK